MILRLKRILLIVMLMVITFCCGSKGVKAYYQFTKNSNINFTTAGYNALTLSTDKSLYGLCGTSASMSFTISNQNDYAVTYTIGFSNSALTYTIDGSAGASYTVNAGGSKTHTIIASGTTSTTSLTITVSPTGPYKSSHTKSVTLDVSCPTASITSTNNVAASQTATISCSDTEGMSSYYWGTSSSPAASEFTTITSNLSTTQTISAAGTYNLICKDENGNTSTTSKTFYKTTLTMTTGTVSPTSVITMSGNSFALPTPTATAGYTNIGAWYTTNSYSTSKGNYGASYTPTSSVTLYSKANANTYTVTYYMGTTSIGTTECTYKSSCTLKTWDNLETTFKNSGNGWDFAGWSTSTSGTTRTYDDSNRTFTYNTVGNTSLYAVGSRTFTFYSGKAPTSVLSSQTQYWNTYSTSELTSINIPNATTIDGWTFIGYRGNDTASSTVRITADEAGKAQTLAYNDITIFEFRSIYERNVSIKYNANGGTGTVSDTTTNSNGNTAVQYYNSGYALTSGTNAGANVSTVKFTLASNGFSKTGYTFNGWGASSSATSGTAAGGSYSFKNAVDEAAYVTMYPAWEVNTYTIGYTLNGGTAGANAPTSGTYDSLVTIDNPTRSGYTFKGWTASGLDTSTAKYGTTTSPATAWNGTKKVTSKYFKNLRSTSGTVTLTANWEYTATFYYWDATDSKIASTTATCTGTTSCSVTIPTAVTGSTGEYGNAYAGLATSLNTATASVTQGTTTLTLSANTTYYGIYSSNVTVYYPKSTTEADNETWYRNSYFTSTTEMSTILGSSATATSNTSVTQVSGYSHYGFATTVNTRVRVYTTVKNAAASTSTTLYAISRIQAIGTFYYYSSGIKSTTANEYKYLKCATTTTAELVDSKYTIPTVVIESTGEYENAYIGVTPTTSSMSSSTSATTASQTYYAVYRTNVTVYYPTSTSAVSSVTWYRNSYFTSTSAMSTVLSTSSTGTSNATTVSGILGTYKGLATAVNTSTTITIAAAAASTTTTFYAVSTNTITATFYYQSNTTAGTCTVTSATADGQRTNYCTSTTTATSVAGDITVPTVVSESVGKYNAAYAGVATAVKTMSTTTPKTSTTTYYAVYRKNVTNYYYSSSYTSRTIYRNEWLTSTTACGTPVLSTSKTGTTNYSTAAGPGSSEWTGLATSATTTVGYSSVSAAAKSTKTKLYTIYTFNVTYAKGANVSAIDATSGSCKVTTDDTSCSVTLPSITANTGYTSVGWSTTNGATTGTAAGESKTISSNSTTLYANAEANNYTITYYLGNASSSAGATKIGTSTCTYGSSCKLTTWATLGASFPNSGNGWSFKGWSTTTGVITPTDDNYYANGATFTYDTAGNIKLYALGIRNFYFYSGKAPTSVLSTEPQYWNPYGTAESYLTSINIPNATAITTNGWEFYGYRANNTASSTATFTTTGATTPEYNDITTFHFRTIYKRTVTVKYNANGGSGTTSSTEATQYYNSGAASGGSNSGANVSKPSITLAANKFTKTGYTFSKWAAGSTSGTQYAAGDEYSFSNGVDESSSVTMYAIWTANPIRVYYNVNGGTLLKETDGGTFTTDSSGFVKVDGSLAYSTCDSSENVNFWNWNNPKYLSVTKDGYTVTSGAQWNTKADGSGTSYSHSANYSYATLKAKATDKGSYYRLDLYVNWVEKPIYVYYNANGGTPTATTDGGTYGTDSSGFVIKNGSLLVKTVNTGGSVGTNGFDNYNYSAGLNIKKTGWTGKSGAQWNTKADGTGTSYNQTTNYTYATLFADPELQDFGSYYSLYLYVNWVDTANPTITAKKTICVLKGSSFTANDVLKAQYLTIADTGSGVKTKTASGTINTSQLGSYTVTVTVTDVAGNTATKEVTVYVYTKIVDSVTIVNSTIHTGDRGADIGTNAGTLYADPYTTGRYVFVGTSPNNYVTFAGSTWRIVAIEPDGRYKLVNLNAGISARAYEPTASRYNSNSYCTDASYGCNAWGTTPPITGTFSAAITAKSSLNTYLNSTYLNSLTNTTQLATNTPFPIGAVTYESSTDFSSLRTQENAITENGTVGLLTLSDFLLASTDGTCVESTLKRATNAAGYCDSYNWLKPGSTAYWLITSYGESRYLQLQARPKSDDSGSIKRAYPENNGEVRPVVYLLPTTTFLGSGTSSSPYTICTNCKETSVSSTTCSITAKSGYVTSQTLTITPSTTSGITYSWDGTNYSSTKTKTVTAAGTYVAYIKDSSGKVNSCSVTIKSRTEYRTRSCTGTVTYDDWSSGSTTYNSTSCTEYTKETKRVICNESYVAKWSYSGGSGQSSILSSLSNCNSWCNGQQSSISGTLTCTCYPSKKTQTRTCTCSAWGSWSGWVTTAAEASCDLDVETRTTYGK